MRRIRDVTTEEIYEARTVLGVAAVQAQGKALQGGHWCTIRSIDECIASLSTLMGHLTDPRDIVKAEPVPAVSATDQLLEDDSANE